MLYTVRGASPWLLIAWPRLWQKGAAAAADAGVYAARGPRRRRVGQLTCGILHVLATRPIHSRLWYVPLNLATTSISASEPSISLGTNTTTLSIGLSEQFATRAAFSQLRAPYGTKLHGDALSTTSRHTITAVLIRQPAVR